MSSVSVYWNVCKQRSESDDATFKVVQACGEGQGAKAGEEARVSLVDYGVQDEVGRTKDAFKG
jgi:hypothetical protein